MAFGLLASAAAVVAPLRPHPAAAAATTATMAVSATVLSTCLVVALPMVFGNYAPTAASDAQADLTVTCTPGTTYTLSLDKGLGSGATLAQRAMSFLTNSLTYSLYTTAARSVVWGDGTGGTATVTGTGTILPQLITVYGRIPASQNTAPGIYTDVVTVTLTY
ncbi:Csu type fimbrial protein [Roseicella frigidaeris]|uniref:Csu type fimbrial protein n=1 Tax=Roseicella frigidaeris TaxID=2230885 RepID=UPI001403314F|nr:spore coat U domain-containing protein [Roseicella frigidaeris]